MNKAPQKQTIDQERAAHALERVEMAGTDPTSVTDSMPAMVMGSGLGPAAAFLKSKGKKEHDWVYGSLQSWLCSRSEIPWAQGQQEDLIDRLASEDSFVYRAATQEALAYLGWLKRLARAKFGKKK